MSLVTNVIQGSNAGRLMLLVHGFGADERDLGGLLPYLDPDGNFATVLPRGPIAAPPGFAWYDIAGITGDAAAATTGFADSLQELDDLLDEQCAGLGFAREQAVVAGFSQGSALALAIGLRRSDRPHPAAVLALSSYLPDDVDYDWEAAASIPVLVQHGSHDPLIPVERGRELARSLEAHGVPVVYGEYPMEHQVALESMQDAQAWLDRVRAGERPSEPVPDDPPEGPVKAVTTASFDQEVLRADVPVIVDFWAPWCQPCRQVSPIVEQIALMRDGSYKVVKVNIDEEPALAQQFEVQSIPMIGLFRNGRLERSSLGLKPRPQLEAELGMLVIP
ncbi:MAG: thioredoxin [Acidimicrobiia bacterium]